ncbi:MAG: VWA domain-containing protein [Alistipes sp.]|nr:VWA domain-containing protein [Alistipes sp.]MBQ5924036.1 VWA domain-containing protein [Alistipes sp.]
MFTFGAPEWLWLLVIVALLPLIYWMLRIYARRKLSRMGNITTLQRLMPDYSSARGWIKIALLTLAAGFMVVALARPQTGSKLHTVESQGREIVLVVDVSNSMLAEDVSPSRMARTRYAISRLVERMNNDRIGIVAFADEAEVLLPITADYKMAESVTKRLSPDLIAAQGTDIGEALEVALLSFTRSTKDSKSRVIILITDGEAHDSTTEAAIEQAKAEGAIICAIGIGTPEGTPLKINGEIMEDNEGKMVVTKLGEPLLQQLAEATGGIYTRSRNDSFGLDEIIARLDEMEATQLSLMTFEEYDEQYQWFLGVALLLLIAEMLIFERRNPLLKGVKLFER